MCPEDATNKRVVWSSSNPEIVFVNPNGGLSSAQGKEGQAKIIATAEDNGGAYAECIVNVNPPIPVTGIDICATKLSLCVGEIGCVCASSAYAFPLMTCILYKFSYFGEIITYPVPESVMDSPEE